MKKLKICFKRQLVLLMPLARTSLVVFTVLLIALLEQIQLGFYLLMLVTQGYKPDQPIAFSHSFIRTNGVDCNYCHHTARHSKSAAIPSANVCMNCHTYINEGPSGTAEIQKIYDAVGFDPEKGKYIEGYEQKLSSGFVFTIYQTWHILTTRSMLLLED